MWNNSPPRNRESFYWLIEIYAYYLTGCDSPFDLLIHFVPSSFHLEQSSQKAFCLMSSAFIFIIIDTTILQRKILLTM